MKILALDSSGLVASVAVVEDDNLLGEYTVNYKKTHSQTLLPMLDEVAKMIELDLETVDAIAVSAGPGSFTGLRIGMATAKGLVQGAGKQLIAVPTLDCLAQNLLHYPGIICPIMNAQKKQVYTALYRGVDKLERLSDYQAIEAEKLAQQLQQLNEDVWFVGDGVAAFADVFTAALGTRCHFADGNLVLPRAGALAMLAAQKAEQGQFDDLFQTELIYIRKSEAEVQWEARHQNL